MSIKYENIEVGQLIPRGSQIYSKEDKKWEYYWTSYNPFVPDVTNQIFDPKELRRPKNNKNRKYP